MRFGPLIAAIVLAAIAAVVVLRMSGNDAPPPTAQVQQAPQMKTVNIFVAAKPIAIGSKITPDMVVSQPWPEHLMLSGFVPSDGGTEKVIGTIARAPFQQQEPILASKLANPNDPNFLAGELPQGMRVISIITNETEGLAGFVFPGDHVDVILTHEVEREKVTEVTSMTSGASGTQSTTNIAKTPYKEPVTETLLNNVLVVAVDQRATGAGATDKDGKLIIPRSVSLMVSQVDAQRIRLGQKIGTLTLSLRALADRDSVDPMTIVGSESVSQYREPKATVPSMPSDVVIYRGAPKENTGKAPDEQPAFVGAAPVTFSATPSTSTPLPAAPAAPELAGKP